MRRAILTLVVLAIVFVVAVIVGLGAWSFSASTSGGAGGVNFRATPITIPSRIVNATPTTTSTAIPRNLNPERLTLPRNAKLRTVGQAIAYARSWAKQDGATAPRLIEVRLETLKTALVTIDGQNDTHPSDSLAGWSPADQRHPVWRVLFAGTVRIPSCPAPANGATPTGCGTTSSVEYVFDPVTGGGYAESYGVIPLPAATP